MRTTPGKTSLTAMCHAVTCAIELIPEDRPRVRRMACAYPIKEIVGSVESMIGSERVHDRSMPHPIL
jgi:hypothetical protein